MPSLDPELLAAIAKLTDVPAEMPRLPRGDWKNRRAAMDTASSGLDRMLAIQSDIYTKDFRVETEDGTNIPLRWYKSRESDNPAALVYMHGGGKIGGGIDFQDPICRYYASHTGVGILSVGYRLAPEHPFPTPVEDCYAGLAWLAEHASELNVALERIGILGDSGGGGIAAGVALMARDRTGPAIAKQFLIYPMLDDRNTEADPSLEPFASWSYDDNHTGWQCFLGSAFGTDAVSPYAAPARATDLANLPPTFIDVGELDIFRDESVHYAVKLIEAGASVELHVYPGAIHGFDILAPDSGLGRVAWQARFRAIDTL